VISPGRHFEKINVSGKESTAELLITCGLTEYTLMANYLGKSALLIGPTASVFSSHLVRSKITPSAPHKPC